MRVVIDEDIPRELTPLFGAADHIVHHVADLGLSGVRIGVPAVIEADASAPKHAVTVVGTPVRRRAR